MTADQIIDAQCAAFAMLLTATVDVVATVAAYGITSTQPTQ